MTSPLPDADFIRLFEEVVPTEAAKRLGVALQNVLKKRRRLEAKLGRPIVGPDTSRNRSVPVSTIPGRLHTNSDGVVVQPARSHQLGKRGRDGTPQGHDEGD